MRKRDTLAYIVYNEETTMEVGRFDTFAGAKRSMTCKNRKLDKPVYAAAEANYYNTNVVFSVERTNLMSGKKYMEASNTPNYCSPSSESYWSM